LKIERAAKRRKKHKNKISWLVISNYFNKKKEILIIFESSKLKSEISRRAKLKK
jgi:hypothetical protein